MCGPNPNLNSYFSGSLDVGRTKYQNWNTLWYSIQYQWLFSDILCYQTRTRYQLSHSDTHFQSVVEVCPERNPRSPDPNCESCYYWVKYYLNHCLKLVYKCCTPLKDKFLHKIQTGWIFLRFISLFSRRDKQKVLFIKYTHSSIYVYKHIEVVIESRLRVEQTSANQKYRIVK